MSIEKVNGKMYVSFGESANTQPVKTKKTPEEIKDGKKKLALALGALAVAGAVTAGVVIAVKKGKLNNSQIKNVIKESADDIGNAVKNSADDVNNAAKNAIKESADDISNALKNSADDVNNAAKKGIKWVDDVHNTVRGEFDSFDDFKKIGTFDKGKAFIDGKEFSGTIKYIGKDGQNRLVLYQQGLLDSVAEMPNSDPRHAHTIKFYEYAADGTKTIFDVLKEKKTIINPDKSINITQK